MTIAFPVTRADLAVLHDPSPDSLSGFHGVYRHKGRWRAVAMQIDVCQWQPTPRAAAIELVRFYFHWYGPNWRRFYEARKSRPFEFVGVSGGFKVMVFLLGKQYYLTPRRIDRRTVWLALPGAGAVFPSRAAAKEAYREFLDYRYGMFAPLAGLELRREFFSPHRQTYLKAREKGWMCRR